MENNTTVPAPAVSSPEPTLAQQMEELDKKFLIHEKFKKHCVKTDEDGDADRKDEEHYIDYSTMLCPGCGMPVQSEGYGDNRKWECKGPGMGALVVHKKAAKNKAVWLKCMNELIAGFKTSRKKYHAELGHLKATTMWATMKDHLDLETIHSQILYCISKEGEQDYEKRIDLQQAYHNLVRLEENLMGGVKPETLKLLKDYYNGAENKSYYNTREHAAELTLALALKHNHKLERKDITMLMKRCKNLRLKHEMTAKMGHFRLGAVRGTVIQDCWPSYHYIKKYKPELLQDYKWTAKKLRFDKHENALVRLQYYLDFGIGLDQIHEQAPIELECAIAYFKPELHAADKEKIAERKRARLFKEQSDEYTYLFGNRQQRKEVCDTTDGAVIKMLFCRTIEEWIQAQLPEGARSATGSPINDVLNLESLEDED